MNRHIFGFIFFSLIVGTSAIVYGFFFAPLATIQPVFVFESQPEKRKSCRRERFERIERSEVKAKVVQAVLDQNTNQLDMDIFLKRINGSNDEVTVWLSFFTKDGAKTRYLTTEKVFLMPEFSIDDTSINNLNLSYDWLDDVKSRENLYVVPQTIKGAENYEKFTPSFDEANALPVTVVPND